MFGDIPQLGAPPGQGGGSVYPLSEYGFIAASGWPPEAFSDGQGNSPLGSWYVRVPVPTDKPLTAVGVLTSGDGVLGAGGLNAYGVYADDGQTLLGQSATNNNLYVARGWCMAALSAQIPPVSSGFVRVLLAINGYTTPPNAAFAIVGPDTGAAYGGGYNKAGHRRSAFISISSFPASFTPSTFGTATQYMPLVVVA